MKKITIVKNGPYVVTGGVPLSEKIIEEDGRRYKYIEGKPLPQSETYALCRCGKTKTPPFCDGTHEKVRFIGKETASTAPYKDRAGVLRGPGIDLMDDDRCAFARFCHRDKGDAWTLASRSDNEEDKNEAVIAAGDCPAGRLTAVTKDGRLLEPELEPAVEILQDAPLGVSAGIYVKGGIPLVSSEGFEYEKRNRYVLCRCGRSTNMPFCDASHVRAGYVDKGHK